MIAKKNNKKGISYLSEDFSFREYQECDIINITELKLIKDFKENHLRGLVQIGDYHEYAKIEVEVADDDCEYFTSDVPLLINDLIYEGDYPLKKSIEFKIALNKKIALRIFHDNRKQLNVIYRRKVLNGCVYSFNKHLIAEASRFIIVDEDTMRKHADIGNFVEDTSLSLKMDAVRKILKLGSNDPLVTKMSELLQYYLDKYDKNKELTEREELDFISKISKHKNNFYKKILNEKYK